MRRRTSLPEPNRYPLAHFLFTTAEKRGLGPTAIAKAIGRRVSNVCDIESGRLGASNETLEKWAKALKVPAAKLLDLATKQDIAALRSRLAQLEKAS